MGFRPVIDQVRPPVAGRAPNARQLIVVVVACGKSRVDCSFESFCFCNGFLVWFARRGGMDISHIT